MTEAAPSPAPLFELSTGYWAFKTLATAYELQLFARLSGTPGMTCAEWAERCGIDARPARALLTGCASLGLLEKTGERYRNSPLSEAYLVPGKPHHFGGLLTMLDHRLYAAWGQLAEAVRTNRPVTWDSDRVRSLFESQDPAVTDTFWESMHTLSSFTGEALTTAIDLKGARSLLDVGGGSGALALTLCGHWPGMKATVYDLPFVTRIAEDHIEAAGMSGRVRTADGDFFADASLPEGHDVHTFSNVLHDWREADAKVLLKKSFDALAPGGLLVIAGYFVNEEETGPPLAALMGLAQLIETEGRSYTASEYAGWAAEAGFVDPRTACVESVGANGVLTARKPAAEHPDVPPRPAMTTHPIERPQVT
ncbi:methyltransferase domain-containing protein [Streptomyces diacarni]|uniref:Methyltransferase domain-containing protein n=1 Tax=Streptomyces diacarni TaxID=2800381 RepID=A0A367F2Z6_9ACTN|nr:methyltransferase [Streptomyces diacarni]RCG24728.1 methyltransferase domain-containing protein [Streptomyces diacarni]